MAMGLSWAASLSQQRTASTVGVLVSMQATGRHAQAQPVASLKSACRPQVQPTWSLKCEASTWSTTELKFTCAEWNGEGHMLCQRHMPV